MLDEKPTSGVVLRAIHMPCAMSCHVPFQFQIPALHEWHICFAATSIITHLFTGKLLIVGHWFVEQRTTRMTAMCLLRAALPSWTAKTPRTREEPNVRSGFRRSIEFPQHRPKRRRARGARSQGKLGSS